MQDTVATSNLVEVDQVWFGYDERRILKDINLVVPKGKVVAIMGLSGCGKTTLLRLIGGALFPNEGEIRVAGRVVNKLGDAELFELRRKMGMLFQFGALFTDMSSFDNVAFQMREHTDLPESMIRDLALMKLQAHRLQLHEREIANHRLGQVRVLAHLERHVVERGHVGKQGSELEQHAHLAPQLKKLGIAELVHDAAGHTDFALVREKRSADQSKQRRLSAAGQTHDGDHLAFGNDEVDVLQNPALVVAERDLVDFDEIACRHGVLHNGRILAQKSARL